MPPKDHISYASAKEWVEDEIRCDPDISDAELAHDLPASLGSVSADEVAQIRAELQG